MSCQQNVSVNQEVLAYDENTFFIGVLIVNFEKRITSARPLSKRLSKDLQKAFESDRGRVINSAAIRRLQQKTQVFPLERNAAVRSRLTHSLEVLQVGRFIVQKITAKMKEDTVLDAHGFLKFERASETLVEIACLLHDIGNPPFGHFGEYAISQWFTQYLASHSLLPANSSIEVADFARILALDLSSFEGNAQAIRLIHSLLRFNLTYSQAACILKYTRAAYEQKPAGDYLKKKPGFYLSEKPFVDELYNQLSMEKGTRFPLTYIMEAADDISYGIADMEDAVEKGIFTFETLAESLKVYFCRACEKSEYRSTTPTFTHFRRELTFEQLVDDCLAKAHQEPINQTHEFFVRLRVTINHILVEHATEQFIHNQSTVFNGTLNRSLLEDGSKHQLLLTTFATLSIENIFCDKEVETLELQGNKIITALLDEYAVLLTLSEKEFSDLLNHRGHSFPVEARLIRRLPDKHVSAYQESLNVSNLELVAKSLELTEETLTNEYRVLWERYFRCRLLIDFISGMTDQYALDEYQSLCMIK